MRDKMSQVLLMLVVATGAGFLGACEDEPPKKTAVVEEPPPPKEVTATGPFDKLDAPASIVIYGGVDKPSALAGHLSELILNSPTQGAVQLDNAMSTLALRFGLKDGKALDVSKPIRFAVVDPKANQQPFCIAVGIKSRDAFASSLPDKHTKDDAGNAFSYSTVAAKQVFVNYVDDWAVFTGEKEVFAANKPFLVKLIGSAVKGDGGAVINVGHLTKLFATEMNAGLAQLKASAETSSGKLGSPMPGGGMGKMVDWITSIANDLDKVVVTTDASKESGRFQFDMSAKAGSELEKTFNTLGARKLDSMLSRLPADAPAMLVSSFDPDTATELMRGITAWTLQMSLGQNASKTDYTDAMTAYWKASNGEMAIVAFPFEDELRLTMLAGVRDAKAATAAMDTLRGMYKEDSFKKLYEQMGLDYQFKKGAYKIGKVSVDTVRANLVKPKGGDSALRKGKPEVGLKQAMGPAGGMFMKMMSHDFAITDDSIISVYGLDARKLMEAWVEGKVSGGMLKSSGMQRALKTAAPGTFFMLYGSPLAVASAFQGKGGAMPPVGNGIALSAGSTGKVIHFVLEVPSGQAQALVKLLSGLGGM